MANAAIAWANLFDSGTLIVRSEATNTPGSNLKLADIATKWRGTFGTSEYFHVGYDTAQSADTFAVMGLGPTFLSTGTAQLLLSSSKTVVSGDIYTGAVTPGLVDPKYGYLIILLPTAIGGWKNAYINLEQVGASYIEAGRVFIGTRSEFTYNYAPGASRQWVHNSGKTKSSGGQTKIDRASPGKFRVWDFNLGWIDETQRWAVHEALDMANGDHTDVLFISDTASTNLGRDSVWGLVETVSPVIQPFNIADLYSKSYKIEERL